VTLQQVVVAQEIIEVVDTSGVVIVSFDEEVVKDADGKVLYTVKGNLIFEGKSDRQNDIELLVESSDIFHKKKIGKVLSESMTEVVYTVIKGGFFLGDGNIDPLYLLAYYEKDENDHLFIINGANDSVLAYIHNMTVPNAVLVAFMHTIIRAFDIDKKVIDKVKIAKSDPDGSNIANTQGSIRRLWNTGNDVFVWDGQMLTRKWNSFDYEEWTFDGYSLRRAWYPGNEEFVWDGYVMRRRWFSSPDEFEWDGTILRRRFGTFREEYIIQGNIIKRYLENNPDDEWQIDGEIPIPIIALVVFDLLRK